MPADAVRTELGIFAKTFHGTAPHAVLSQARDAGFSTVQYNMACSGLSSLPSVISPDIVDGIRTAMRDTGVGIAALSATYNMIHPDATVRAAGHRSLAVLADAAQALGIPILTLCSGSRNAGDQWATHPDNAGPAAWRDLLYSLERAIPVAERCGLTLGVEPESSNVVSSPAIARRLLDELRGAPIGIVFDAANLSGDASQHSAAASRDVIANGIELLADRIILVHAKDRRPDGTFVSPGDGVLDFRAYFTALAASRITAPVITHGLTAAEAPRAATFLRQCLPPRSDA